MYGVRAVATDALISLISGMGSVSSEDPINRQRQTARGAGIRDYCHSSAPVGPTLTMAGAPRTGRMRRMGPKLPYTLTSENNCLPAARCIRATLRGKDDELRFAPLRGHVLTRKSTRRVLGCAAWLRWSLWRRRDHEPAAIYDSGADGLRNGRSRGVDRWLAGWLRFGRHREHPRSANRGPRSISRRHRQARG